MQPEAKWGHFYHLKVDCCLIVSVYFTYTTFLVLIKE